jgi:hypothetical protein
MTESDPGETEIQRDLYETLPPEIKGVNDINNDDEIEKLYDQFQKEDDEDYEIDKIVDHAFKDGILILKVIYQGGFYGGTYPRSTFCRTEEGHTIGISEVRTGPHTGTEAKLTLQTMR